MSKNKRKTKTRKIYRNYSWKVEPLSILQPFEFEILIPALNIVVPRNYVFPLKFVCKKRKKKKVIE